MYFTEFNGGDEWSCYSQDTKRLDAPATQPRLAYAWSGKHNPNTRPARAQGRY